MTAQATHWMEIGEPTGNNRVEATHRIAYETGPNESKDDDVTHGTLSFEAVDYIFGHEHQHSDGSLLLSAVGDSATDEIMADFEPEE